MSPPFAGLPVGSLELVSFPFEPFGLDLPVVGVLSFVSADTVRPLEVTGAAFVLSMKASESVTTTPTAIPAPEPAADESATVVIVLVMLEVIFTLPFVAEIELVSESWLFALATSTVAATDESLLSAFSQWVLSVDGAAVLSTAAMLSFASYRLPSVVSVTTSPLL